VNNSARACVNRPFASLGEFISALEQAPFADRKAFVSWILHETDRADGKHLVKPYPLQTRIIDSTLAEWLKCDPESGEAHRWIGGDDHLKQALSIDPDDQIVRRKIIVAILDRVAHSMHELPEGYLGDPEQDRIALTDAASLLEHLSDEQLCRDLSSDVSELMAIVQEHLDRRRALRSQHLLAEI
jgi:hypothetical protein